MVRSAGGVEVPLRANLISISQRRELRAPIGKVQHKQTDPAAHPDSATARPAESESREVAKPFPKGEHAASRAQTIVVAATPVTPESTLDPNPSPQLSPPHSDSEFQAGTRGQIILLSTLSASKNHAGDLFRALLVEPLPVGSRRSAGGQYPSRQSGRGLPSALAQPPGVSAVDLHGSDGSGRCRSAVAAPASPSSVEVDQQSQSTMCRGKVRSS